MRKLSVLLVVALLAAAPWANAGITGYNCDDDGDGVIEMTSTAMDPPTGGTDVTLSMECIHHNDAENGVVGHVEGDFIATPEDPSSTLRFFVENDTGFDWTAYEIKIGMSQQFTILSSPIYLPDTDWSATITQPGSTPVNINGHNYYVGVVNFTGGTAVPDGAQDVEFGFKVSWTSGSIAFCTEQTPVPEPVSLVLMGLGALLLRRSR